MAVAVAFWQMAQWLWSVVMEVKIRDLKHSSRQQSQPPKQGQRRSLQEQQQL
jgi:hypothetical protein